MSRSKENQEYFDSVGSEEQSQFLETEAMIKNAKSSGENNSYWFVRTLPIIIIGFFLIPVILLAKSAGIGSPLSAESLWLICAFPWICGVISEIVISQRYITFLGVITMGAFATMGTHMFLSPLLGV